MSVSIKEHQVAMLELLSEVDLICKKHNICYTLFAGTLIGAVRHKGFIPWDDDLDVIMLRSEYERFMVVAEKELNSDRFFLQKEFSEHWPMFFSKLRLQNTAAIEKYHPKDKKIHQGIYIDIFPCDNLSDNKVLRKLQFAASKVVIAKSLYKRGYETDCMKKKLLLQICRVLPQKLFLSLVKKENTSDSKMVHCFLGAASGYEKSTFPREWFEAIQLMKFEQGVFPVSSFYDKLLTKMYGDYMTIPSEKDRKCKIHAVIVDTKHSYKEYLQQQENMKITLFSRSIR